MKTRLIQPHPLPQTILLFSPLVLLKKAWNIAVFRPGQVSPAHHYKEYSIAFYYIIIEHFLYLSV
ncbi:MAG: hypothetical protein JNM19_00580 [Chitinophagaceae bacterium]|nr:hypothetical protein [Chitinophagaceae bacterium]